MRDQERSIFEFAPSVRENSNSGRRDSRFLDLIGVVDFGSFHGSFPRLRLRGHVEVWWNDDEQVLHVRIPTSWVSHDA